MSSAEPILLVEDDPDMRDALADVLVEEGFSVHTAADGLEALEDRFQIEAVNSPSGVTHVTLSRRVAPGIGSGLVSSADEALPAVDDSRAIRTHRLLPMQHLVLDDAH